jgi:hypothetical protein
LTAGETSSAAPWPENFARPTQAGRLRALVLSAPEPSGQSIFRPYRSCAGFQFIPDDETDSIIRDVLCPAVAQDDGCLAGSKHCGEK